MFMAAGALSSSYLSSLHTYLTHAQSRHPVTGQSLLKMAMWAEARHIHFATKWLGFGHHWALKVGDYWYEVPGTGKENTGEANRIVVSTGECSEGEAYPGGANMVPTIHSKSKKVCRFHFSVSKNLRKMRKSRP